MFYSPGSECLNVKLGTSVKFTLHAKLKSCRPETFVVTPVGIKDQMVVEVEPLCECPCAEEGDGEDLEERYKLVFCTNEDTLLLGQNGRVIPAPFTQPFLIIYPLLNIDSAG